MLKMPYTEYVLPCSIKKTIDMGSKVALTISELYPEYLSILEKNSKQRMPSGQKARSSATATYVRMANEKVGGR